MPFRHAVIAVTLLSFTACTTMRPIEDFTPAAVKHEVEVGDEVRIVATNAKTYEFTVTLMGPESLEGQAASGKRYRIAYEAIESIEVRRTDGWKTAGATLGGAIVIVYLAAVYAVYLFFDAIDDIGK